VPAIARLEFRPIPPNERHTPGRIVYPSARLYIDRFIEHREAYAFLRQQQDLHKEAADTLARALIHYHDSVLKPLEELHKREEETGEHLSIPKAILRTQLAFRPIPPRQRRTPERVMNLSVRLYVDRWVEHRRAAGILEGQGRFYGHGGALKTLVRALLYYRDTVIRPTQKNSKEGKGGQLRMEL
jgi:hypothetical protein